MLLVVGLGNPGPKYEKTRHNVGFMVLDRVADALKAAPFRDKFSGLFTRSASPDVALLKPLTFMNLSGAALQQWQQRHGLGAAELLVVSDDVYLPLGSIRIRPQGSSGGHRGLESIEAALGSHDFARLRLGVGAADSSAQLKEHVLDEFVPEESPALEEMVHRSAEAVESWVRNGVLSAMNQFNRKVRKEVPES